MNTTLNKFRGKDTMCISQAQHDIKVIGDVDITFDKHTKVMTVECSYSPVMKGKEAQKLWDNLQMNGDKEDMLMQAKRIASSVCGINNYNDRSRKPKQAFFRYLVIWYATTKLKFSNDEARNIFSSGTNNVYHSVSRIESDDKGLKFHQIQWRRTFMSQINDIK